MNAIELWLKAFRVHLNDAKFVGVEMRCDVCRKFLGSKESFKECVEHPDGSPTAERKDWMSVADIHARLDVLAALLAKGRKG